MDTQKFDSLVKTLASPTSRRRIVKGAAVAGLGSLLAFGGQQTTEAAPPDEAFRCNQACTKACRNSDKPNCFNQCVRFCEKG